MTDWLRKCPLSQQFNVLIALARKIYPAYNVLHGQENRNEQLITLDLNDCVAGACRLDVLQEVGRYRIAIRG